MLKTRWDEAFSDKELAVLRARAERLAQTSDGESAETLISALALDIAGQRYALPIESLTAVYEDVNVVPVPGTPGYVAGIANIRGRIIAALDLAPLLAVVENSDRLKRGLIVAAGEGFLAAFHVHGIGEVMSFKQRDLNPLPAGFEAIRGEYIQGILPDGTGLLDVTAILSDQTLIVSDTAG